MGRGSSRCYHVTNAILTSPRFDGVNPSLLEINKVISEDSMRNGQGDEFVQRLSSLISLGCIATKYEYRAAVQFVCSEASNYMNGQNLVMDGGHSPW